MDRLFDKHKNMRLSKSGDRGVLDVATGPAGSGGACGRGKGFGIGTYDRAGHAQARTSPGRAMPRLSGGAGLGWGVVGARSGWG